MEWDADLAAFFGDDGALREVFIPGTSVRDWQAVFIAIRKRYLVEAHPDLLPEDPIDAMNMEAKGIATVDPHGLVLNCHFLHGPGAIEFDLAPTDIRGQAELDRLCEFMALVSQAAGRDAFLSLEGCPERPVLRYDVKRGEILRLSSESRSAIR